MDNINENNSPNESLFLKLISRLFSNWVLFISLLAVGLGIGTIYLQYAPKTYEARASLLLNDEKKGIDESKMSESLNYVATKKIIENEMEILRSRSLIRKVVDDLDLGLSVWKKQLVADELIYPAPFQVKWKNLTDNNEVISVELSGRKIGNRIQFLLNGKEVKNNEWVKIGRGSINIDFTQFKDTAKYVIRIDKPTNVVNSVFSNLEITPVNKLSTVVMLNLKDNSRARAVAILSRLIDAYKNSTVSDTRDLALNTLAFVEDRLKSVERELAEIESRVEQYKSEKGAFDISSQGKLVLESLSLNDNKVSDLNMQLAVLNQVEKYATNSSSGSLIPSSLGVQDPALNELVTQLYATELEYEELRKTTAENNPVLSGVKNKLVRIRENIVSNIQSQKLSLEASKKNLANTAGSYSTLMQKMPQKERELLEISREQSIKSNIYSFLLQRREEAALSSSSISAVNVKVIDEAEALAKAAFPKRGYTYLASLSTALILFIFIIYWKENLTGKIQNAFQIQKETSLPILAEIGYQKSENAVVVGAGMSLVANEQFRRLRITFPYLGINKKNKRILVTSSIPGEGKSFMAINLAITLSEEGNRVILIDADLRNPTLAKRLGLQKETGISDFLQNKIAHDQMILATGRPNLDLISSGTYFENSTALYLNGKMEKLLTDLDLYYDFIVIDSPPAGVLSDAFVLSPMCDATLYVVRHAYTPKDCIRSQLIQNKVYGLKNVAIVFNSVRASGRSHSKYSSTYYGYEYLRD